jgi:transposase-like protein
MPEQLPSIAQEDLRRKVIKAILEGKTQVEAAQIFGITRQAVGKWVKNIGKEGSEHFGRKREEGPRSVLFCPGKSGSTRSERLWWCVWLRIVVQTK